jgi:hypothetical protein
MQLAGSCYFLLLFLFVTVQGFGQSRISGKVESDGQPVPFVNVLLMSSQDSSLVKGMMTGESGAYEIDDIKPGQYLILASMIGYQKTYSAIFSVPPTKGIIQVNTINLELDSRLLGEVKVEANKPLFEQQIDRMVVNVQSSITAASGTALEVLERSPGVLVDHHNSAISMNGKNGVQVMVNGKLSRMPMESLYQLLSSMPAANIEQIELITTPPANMDAEGNAGYVNIVLRKNEAEGLNGSFFFNAEKKRRFNGASGAAIDFRKNKFSLFASYAFTANRNLWYVDTERQRIFPDYQLDFNSQAARKGGADAHNFRLGIDYQLSPKTVIGLLTTVFDRNWAQVTDMSAHFNLTPGIDSLVYGLRKDKNPSEQYMANVNLKHNFTDKQQFNLDVDYFYNHSNQPQDYTFNYLLGSTLSRQDEIRINKDTPMDIWVAKADYSLQASDRLSLETGVKATYSGFSNEVLLENRREEKWVKDPAFSEKASMDEMIGAAFGQLSLKINQATEMKAGLRYEYTDTRLFSQNAAPIFRKYGSWFPTLYFSKKLSTHDTWQFSYNRRISRPAFSELAPFVLFLDPVTFLTGNSFLWPSFTQGLKTDYSHKGIIFSLQANRTQNAIYGFQPQAKPQTNVTVYSSLNIDREDTYIFSLTWPLNLTSWWNAQNNLQAIRQQVETGLNEGFYEFSEAVSALIPAIPSNFPGSSPWSWPAFIDHRLCKAS